MTWSLRLDESGDLALGGKGLDTVTKEKKLVQDLKCELLEKKGEYPFNPNYGSLLEDDLIAELQNTSVSTKLSRDEVIVQIESHIGEVINRYQKKQLGRAKADKMSRGKATLTPEEVVVDFAIVNAVQNLTTVKVEVRLTTAATNKNAYEDTYAFNGVTIPLTFPT